MKRFVLEHRVAVTVLAVAAVVTILLVMTMQPKITDSDVAYCLAHHEEQRSQLVDAAVALGFAQQGDTTDQLRVDGRNMTPEEWRSAHEPAFQRSCLALNPPQPRLSFLEQIVSAESGLVGVLAALIGGGAYYLAERSRDRAQRRGDDARRVNDLGTAFVAAVENYVWQRSSAIPPERLDVDRIRTLRNELVSELQLVQARHHGWTAPDDPLAALHGTLSDQIIGDWHDRKQRRAELIAALNQLAKELSSIAVELERGRPQSKAASR